MDVVSLVALSVPLPVYPPHRLVWRDEKTLSPTENKCNIVVLIEMGRPPARLNEPGCERRSSKYSSTSHCYHSLNLLLQTPRPRRNSNPGLFIFKPSNYWVFHVSVFKVVFQPERRVPHIGECLLSFPTCHLVWSSILCNM